MRMHTGEGHTNVSYVRIHLLMVVVWNDT